MPDQVRHDSGIAGGPWGIEPDPKNRNYSVFLSGFHKQLFLA
jgi:hypothetical protein